MRAIIGITVNEIIRKAQSLFGLVFPFLVRWVELGGWFVTTIRTLVFKLFNAQAVSAQVYQFSSTPGKALPLILQRFLTQLLSFLLHSLNSILMRILSHLDY